MLKKMFKIEHIVSISDYSLLNEFLKRNCDDYKAKKAIVFIAQNVNDIYTDGSSTSWEMEILDSCNGLCGTISFFKRVFSTAISEHIENENKVPRCEKDERLPGSSNDVDSINSESTLLMLQLKNPKT